MLQQLIRLVRTGIPSEPAPAPAPDEVVHAELQQQVLRVLGRALTIRHVDAGSCNACELEIQALNNPYYNLEGLGIRFVASPRHADLLLVTGPVSRHMAIALRRTYEAMADPKLVVAAGGCACTGGIFGASYASLGRVANVLPVNVEIPGCPPSPRQLLEGILAAVTVAAPPQGGADVTAAPSPQSRDTVAGMHGGAEDGTAGNPARGSEPIGPRGAERG